MALEQQQEEYKFPDEAEKKDGEVEAKDDLEIEVIDDTPEEDRGRQPMAKEPEEVTETELAEYSDKVRNRIKELTRARHDERRAKEAALREREEMLRVTSTLVNENKKLKEYVHTGEKAYATTAVAAAEAEVVAAKTALKKAHEDFDTDAIVAAQEALTEAKMRLSQAKSFKPTPLQDTEEPVYTGHEQAQQPVKPDEKTLRWQQRNQWFGVDDEMTGVALIKHKQLVSSGVDPRSDEYYSQIDAHMKKRFPEFFVPEKVEEDEKPAPRREKPSTVVAPATRSASPKRIKLTQTQLKLAARFNLTPEQYAKELLKLENANG
jgi:hypothetical protein